MKLSYSVIKNFHVKTLDSEDAGKVRDLLFDDRNYEVQHLVVRCGNWLTGESVLVRPSDILSISPESRFLTLQMKKDDLKNSPSRGHAATTAAELDQELRDQKYADISQFPGPYVSFAGWGYIGKPPKLYSPDLSQNEAISSESVSRSIAQKTAHLRSFNELEGYQINDSSGEDIGKIKELILDFNSGSLQYVVADTGSWLNSKEYLLSTDWITRLDAHNSSMSVGLSKKKIESCPTYSPSQPINATMETQLHDFYGRPYYWQDRSNYEVQA